MTESGTVNEEIGERAPTSVVYVTDLTYEHPDPADLFDLAFLLRSPEYVLQRVILAGDQSRGELRVLGRMDKADSDFANARGPETVPNPVNPVHPIQPPHPVRRGPDYTVQRDAGPVRSGQDGERVLDAMALRTRRDIPVGHGSADLARELAAADEPMNIVVVGGYDAVTEALAADPALFREKVARVFLVGGCANDYGPESISRLPTDPWLRERNPERFSVDGDPRIAGNPRRTGSWATLLTSGEGIIWLPRDICLWRYAAPGILEDGGSVCEFLLRELFAANLSDKGQFGADRFAAADAPALISALPALLLARRPDPFVWMRLFRTIAARVAVDPHSGRLIEFSTATDRPNLHAVVAVDGQLLGKRLTAALRVRPSGGG